jgi:hypothetical protein
VSAELFDLGVRLRAYAIGTVQPRLAHTPYSAGGPFVAVSVSSGLNRILRLTVQRPGGPAVSGSGHGALRLLLPDKHSAPDKFETLVVSDRAQLRKLMSAASSAKTEGHEALARACALVDWWARRTEHPGTSAVLAVIDACRTRWVSGSPGAHENVLSTWAGWLGAKGSDTAALLAIAARLVDGAPLDPENFIEANNLTDRTDYLRQRDAINAGAWRRSDSPRSAARGLQSRADAAERMDAVLHDDTAWRERAIHTGYVVRTTVHTAPTASESRVILTTSQRICRYRPGTTVRLETPIVNLNDDQPTISGTVLALDACADGTLRITVKIPRGKTMLLKVETPVTLLPDPVVAARQNQGLTNLSKRLKQSDCWLVTGKPMPKIVREVPLDVVIAAAE